MIIAPKAKKHNRISNRAVITASVPIGIASQLDAAAERLGTNRSRMIETCIRVGLPIVVLKAMERQEEV